MNNRIIKKIIHHPWGSFYYLLMNIRGFSNKFSYGKNAISLKQELTRNNIPKLYFFEENIVFEKNLPLSKNKINWLLDDSSKYQWNLDFYLKIRNNLYKDYGKGRDIKNVWEKSRFYDMPSIALKYSKTADQKYLNYFENAVLDWDSNNPWGYGPNWAIAMEVSLRICNLILAFKIFEKNLDNSNHSFTPGFKEKFLTLVIKHGKFIKNNLELFPTKTNHYLSDVIGLLYIGFAFPQLKVSKGYINFGLKELFFEMERQVGNDGVDKEGSTGYHKFKLELFAYGALLFKQNKENNKIFIPRTLDAIFWTKLHKMFEYVFLYTKPHDNSPQIGDNDKSELHHTDLIKLYNLIFNNTYKMFDVGRCCLLDDSGIGIIKADKIYLFIGRKNPNNNNFPAHFHNDIGSFELNIDGVDFIIDPGTCCYTENIENRNKMRKTSSHNTIMSNNTEQNEFDHNELFFMNFASKNSAKTNINLWEDNEKECTYEIQWKLLKSQIKRNFNLNKIDKILYIKDTACSGNNQILDWFFHIGHLVKITKKSGSKENYLILTSENKEISLSFQKELDYEILDDIMSPGFHEKISSKTLHFFVRQVEKEKEYTFKLDLK